jgi:hypothetical protein
VTELLPVRTPVWLPIGAVEVTAWPLITTDDVFVVGSDRTARLYAAALDARLPTPHEEDLIWEHAVAAGVTIDPPTRTGPPWPSSEDQSARVVAALRERGADFDTLVANTGKPWLNCNLIGSTLVRRGHAVNYGWFVRASDCDVNRHWKWIPTYSTLSQSEKWRVLQPLSDFHRDDDIGCGYETHIRLVRPR